MIHYKKYKNINMKSSCYGKWYGRAVHELMEFDEFVTHLATHHCAFSEATIRGVLIEMENCLRELLLEGKAVRFDELGIFRIGLKTKPAESAKEFNAAKHVVGCRMNLRLGKRFLAANLSKDMRLREADHYNPLDDDDDTDDGN